MSSSPIISHVHPDVAVPPPSPSSSSSCQNSTDTNTAKTTATTTAHSSLPFRHPPTVLQTARGELGDERGRTIASVASSPLVLRHFCTAQHQEAGAVVVVVRGLPRDVVEAVLAEGLVPPTQAGRFVRTGLAQRKPWRPMVCGRGGSSGSRAGGDWGANGSRAATTTTTSDGETGEWRFGGYVWEYPEVVELGGEAGGIVLGDGRTGDDNDNVNCALPPTVMALPGSRTGQEQEGSEPGRKLGVVFCRAGLWFGKERSVLFLDRNLRSGREQGRDKARKRENVAAAAAAAAAAGAAGAASAGASEEGKAEAETDAQGEVREDLEDMVREVLRSDSHAVDRLPAVVAEVVYHQWLVLFDYLELHPRALDEVTMACYLRIMRSLELNDEAEDGDTAWRKLLARLQRRIQLLSSASPVASPSTPRTPVVSGTTGEVSNMSKRRIGSQPGATDKLCFAQCRHAPLGQKSLDEDKRALDRLSYLAGILSPLSIVSGILSMGDVFGPDGKKFFIYWAVAAPLTGLVLLLIHADTIRKAVVWVEIGSDRVVPLLPPEKGRDEEVRPTPGRLRHHVAPVAVDHEAEERNLGMPTTTTDSSTISGGLDDEGRQLRCRWSTTSWEQVPAVILERRPDGSKPRAWKRERLGWRGAIIAIVLFRRLRDGSDIPEGVAACEKRGRCRAKR
ncbi:hypothetical protein VTH82DRAFT_21 [Thermothelomyces myriococcoides]